MTVNGHSDGVNGAGSAGGYHDDDIAIIGMDLKFPGDAASPEEFFKLLLEGRSALSDVGPERYNIDAFYHPDPERAGAVSLVSFAVHLSIDFLEFFTFGLPDNRELTLTDPADQHSQGASHQG